MYVRENQNYVKYKKNYNMVDHSYNFSNNMSIKNIDFNKYFLLRN